MKTIKREELAALRMVAGGEKRFLTVIDGDTVYDWVGVGWVKIREASQQDYDRYPVVVDSTATK